MTTTSLSEYSDHVEDESGSSAPLPSHSEVIQGADEGADERTRFWRTDIADISLSDLLALHPVSQTHQN